MNNMFVQNIEEMEQLIAIPIGEYTELIGCRTRLNAVYGLLTSRHTLSLKCNGRKESSIESSLLEVVSGYEENENYFNYLRENFIKRRGV